MTGVLSVLVLMLIPVVAQASSHADTTEGRLLPLRCERRVDGGYETRGPATIDTLGKRYVLTVRCEGVHQIYVRVSPALDLAQFVGKPVRARYRYVDETSPRTECVRPPCPPAIQRVIEITALEEVIGAARGANPPGK
jgi:hypothetical protein